MGPILFKVWINFTTEGLEGEAKKVKWNLTQRATNREGLEKMVEELESIIKEVMNKVAPMKVIEVKQKNIKLKTWYEDSKRATKATQANWKILWWGSLETTEKASIKKIEKGKEGLCT